MTESIAETMTEPQNPTMPLDSGGADSVPLIDGLQPPSWWGVGSFDRLASLGRWRWPLLVTIVLLGSSPALVWFWPGSSARSASGQERESSTLLPVQAVTIVPVDSYSVSRHYTGAVKAGRTSELGFEQGGELVWLAVDHGDRVTTGQPLARLDTRRLAARREQLVAQLSQAEALLAELYAGPRQEQIAAARATMQGLAQQLELERLRASRRETLYREGAISREQWDEVAFGANTLDERLASARSQVEELQTGTRPEQIAAQEAAVKQLEASITDVDIAIDKATLYAPFSGVIASRRLDEGTIVEAGQPVVRLLEQGQLEVEVGLPAAAVDRLVIGSQQRVQVGDQPYTAVVQAVLPELDPTTRTRTVVLGLDPAVGNRVAPGQVAKLEISQTLRGKGYWLPTTALLKGDRGLWSCYALTVSASSEPSSSVYSVERRLVEVLVTQGDRVLVRGTLQPGDRIVADGTQRIVPGQSVRLSP